jgi:hypothetical protein
VTEHECSSECVCPVHGTPLIWWPVGRSHACQYVDCEHGHGLVVESRSAAPWPIVTGRVTREDILRASSPRWEASTCARCGWSFCLAPFACEKVAVVEPSFPEGESDS